MRFIKREKLIQIIQQSIPVMNSVSEVLRQGSGLLLSIMAFLQAENIEVRDDDGARALLPGNIKQYIVEAIQEEDA
jgi:hypothetical protein